MHRLQPSPSYSPQVWVLAALFGCEPALLQQQWRVGKPLKSVLPRHRRYHFAASVYLSDDDACTVLVRLVNDKSRTCAVLLIDVQGQVALLQPVRYYAAPQSLESLAEWLELRKYQLPNPWSVPLLRAINTAVRWQQTYVPPALAPAPYLRVIQGGRA